MKCGCWACRDRDPLWLIPLRWLAGVAIVVITVVALSLAPGCAVFKKDVKAVADVCRPELLPDAMQMLPLVAALAACEFQGGDCSAQAKSVEDAGTADAKLCAMAQLHEATVKLASTVDAGTGQ